MADPIANPAARPSTPRPPTQRVAALGLLVNVALAGVKLIAGLVGHSYALVADAIESITDILGSVVIWSGLRYGSRPPDADHPYGHGKAEALAAMVVAAIVFVAGAVIAVESVREITHPHRAPAPFTLIVLVAVVVVKETMFRVARRVSRVHASGAVEVDAFHHRADAITSLAAFFGISLAIFGPRLFGGTAEGWSIADDVAALLASGIILYNASMLMRVPLSELMDREPTDVIARAREIAQRVPGVGAIEKTRARTSGSRAFVKMHVQVAPELSVAQAHAIGGHVRAKVREALPTVADVHIHIEPLNVPPNGPASEPRPVPTVPGPS